MPNHTVIGGRGAAPGAVCGLRRVYHRGAQDLEGPGATPTIITTGEQDLRTPMAQSEEFYQALKARKVPTVLVRFPAESHTTRSLP